MAKKVVTAYSDNMHLVMSLTDIEEELTKAVDVTKELIADKIKISDIECTEVLEEDV